MDYDGKIFLYRQKKISIVGTVTIQKPTSTARAALEHSIQDAYPVIQQQSLQRQMTLCASFADHLKILLAMTRNRLFCFIFTLVALSLSHICINFVGFLFISQEHLKMIPRMMDFVLEDLAVSTLKQG